MGADDHSSTTDETRHVDAARIEITPLDFDAQRDGERPEIEGLIGDSPNTRKLLDAILRACQFDYDILIVGATGTGKTMIARAVHRLSRRAGKPFVEVNSAAFQDDLVESNLFGHVKGAFTGATEYKKGIFEAAGGGVVFFDEIGDMPPSLQAKVLKVIESKTVTPVGSNKAVPCDVQIIFATCQNLVMMVKDGTFREDLLHRINTLRISVPSLAERREDVPELVRYFLEAERAKLKRPEPFRIEHSAMQLLAERDWPGNVRELEKAIQRLVVASFDVAEITLEHVLDVTAANLDYARVGERDTDLKVIHVPPFRIGDSIALYIARVIIYIYNTLFAQIQNHSRVAALLNTDRSSLYQLLERKEKILRNAKEPATVLRASGDGGNVVRSIAEGRKRLAK